MRSQTIGRGSAPRRLLILLADTPIDKVRAVFGTYHDVFVSLFEAALAHAQSSASLQIDSYDVVGGEYPSKDDLASSHALLITGSAASAYADIPWIHALTSFTSTLPSLHPSLRLIGICYGHQILAQALGGRCIANDRGWELGVRHVRLTPLGQRLLPHDADGTVAIHQVHRDIVPSVPEGFELLGSTDDCANQGMVRFGQDGGVEIITLQGHPEFKPQMVADVIDAREAKGILTTEVADKSRVFAREHDDGVAIGAALLRAVALVEELPRAANV